MDQQTRIMAVSRHKSLDSPHWSWPTRWTGTRPRRNGAWTTATGIRTDGAELEDGTMGSTARLRAVVLVALAVLGVASALWGASQNTSGWDWGGLALNLGTELIGALVMYLLLWQVIGSKENREAAKSQLILEMRSPVRDVAAAAAAELRRLGYLCDGSLQGAALQDTDLLDFDLQGAGLTYADLDRADLGGARLRGARMRLADLRGANLDGADLSEADLRGADLTRADLGAANLSGANLGRARLRGARMRLADLRKASLGGADLRSADLEGADLQEADLRRAKLDEKTRLPDGRKWMPGILMVRFTYPEHVEFWRSDDPASPAHRSRQRG